MSFEHRHKYVEILEKSLNTHSNDLIMCFINSPDTGLHEIHIGEGYLDIKAYVNSYNGNENRRKVEQSETSFLLGKFPIFLYIKL